MHQLGVAGHKMPSTAKGISAPFGNNGVVLSIWLKGLRERSQPQSVP